MKLNNKGFTLVEVIVVVAIIVAISIIAAPNILKSLNTGKEKSYDIMVQNIKSGAINMYEEVYANTLLDDDVNIIYNYTDSGVREESNPIRINGTSITVNLQTLVSNGFISGTNNGNTKVIMNPKTQESIGKCVITINRIVSNNKVTYSISSDGSTDCPTNDDYNKGV